MSDAGIRQNVPFAEYAAIDAVNSSAVKWGVETMAHMRAYLRGEIEDDSKAKKFGRAVHCRLLEPERYAEDVLITQRCSAILKGGTQCSNAGRFNLGAEWYCGVKGHRPEGAEEPGEDAISQEEADRIEAIAASLHNADCMRLLTAPGWSEATLVWEDFGLQLKGRLDRLAQDYSTIIDIKKCQRGKASQEACERAIDTFGYHISAALYVSAVEALTGVRPRFVWVFIEDKPPHLPSLIEMDEQTFEIGRFEAERTLQRWKRALRTERYPGYVTGEFIPNGGLPDWRRRQYTDCDFDLSRRAASVEPERELVEF